MNRSAVQLGRLPLRPVSLRVSRSLLHRDSAVARRLQHLEPRRHLSSRLSPSRPLSPHLALSQRHSPRHYSDGRSTLLQRLQALRRSNPVALPMALILLFASGCGLVAVTWIYMTYFVPIDTTYPPAVATKLKRALYYSTQEVQPSKAWDYYKQALQAAEEAGLHPFSAEVLGIKFSAVGMLERTNNFASAVKLLEILRDDCLRFVAWAEGQDAATVVLPTKKPGTGDAKEGSGDPKPMTEEESQSARQTQVQNIKRARSRVLAKTVGTCLTRGELQSNPYVNDGGAAERNLSQAVELALREQQRRAQERVREEDEGPWMSAEELGATFESLADHYESRSKHALASPLYLRAVTLAQPPTCHTAVLMNNLAASLAQTQPERSLAHAAPADTHAAPLSTTRAALIANARAWSEKAREIARAHAADDASGECDVACAVATHNLGEFAEMEGLVAEARRRYDEARALATKLGFQEGVKNADDGLARINAAR